MSINFATLQGLTIPEGVVTQIADASGRILWSAAGGAAVLQVEKIVSNTYAGETTYENEEFILLNIFPKTNGTVNVTYGGLTKTLTDTSGEAEPNALQVFFGTYNGVSDSVETPASGELTIDGEYVSFGVSTYSIAKMSSSRYTAVTGIKRFGNSKNIADYAFVGCTRLTSVNIPSSVTAIGISAFNGCTGLTSVNIPSSVTAIGRYAFCGCINMTNLTVSEKNNYFLSDGGILFDKNKTTLIAHPSVSGHYDIPSSVTTIGVDAFDGCTGLTSVNIPSSVTTIGGHAFGLCTGLTSVDIPSSVTTIGERAFGECTGLTSVTTAATTIYDEAFFGCTSLTSIILREGVKTIERRAFTTESPYIIDIVIPASVEYIGSYALLLCDVDGDLTIDHAIHFTMLGTVPPSMYEQTTYGVHGSFGLDTTHIQITVPRGCGDVYKTTDVWYAYADNITEES